MDKFSALKYYYGYDTFKEGQAEVIDQLLDGRDAFASCPRELGSQCVIRSLHCCKAVRPS